MMRLSIRFPGILTVMIVISVLSGGGRARADWPQFRGPGSLGVVEDERLPTKWSETENVIWKTPVGGMAWSSPIVCGDRIFLTTVMSEGKEKSPKKGLYFGGNQSKPSANTHHYRVSCVDFDSGKILWQRLAQSGPPRNPRHIKNSHASETPCTDGERVYAYFGSIGLLHAYSLDGELAWTRQWATHKTRHDWGTAASPIVHEGRVYIVNDNEEDSFLEAIDAATGSKIWRVNRKEKSNWSTPYVWKNDHRTEIVTTGTGRVRSYSLDGELLWELKGMSSIAIPTPFQGHGLLYISSGYVGDEKRPAYAIRPGASGDISLAEGEKTNDHIAWYRRQIGPYNPSPLLYKDRFWVLYDFGFLGCFDARTGENVFPREKTRIRKERTAFTSSPWAYQDKIFCLSEDGETFVFEAGDAYKLLHVNELDEMCMATPAIHDGSLLIRTISSLYRIGKSKG